MDEDGKFESNEEIPGLPTVVEFTDLRLDSRTAEVAVAWRTSDGATGFLRMPSHQVRTLAGILRTPRDDIDSPTVEHLIDCYLDMALYTVRLSWKETGPGRIRSLWLSVEQAEELRRRLGATLAPRDGPEIR